MNTDIWSGALPDAFDAEENKYYFKKYYAGDLSARQMLIEHNAKLVLSRVTERFLNAPDLEEISAIGMIGLIKAVDTFDLNKKSKFSGYAAICIDNEILMYFRKEKKHNRCDSLDRSPGDTDSDSIDILDTLVDTTVNIEAEYMEKETEFERYKLFIKIRFLVDKLSEREKTIIVLYFGLDGNKAHTHREIAEKLGISRSYVSRIYLKAMKQLRFWIENNEFNINDMDESDITIKTYYDNDYFFDKIVIDDSVLASNIDLILEILSIMPVSFSMILKLSFGLYGRKYSNLEIAKILNQNQQVVELRLEKGIMFLGKIFSMYKAIYKLDIPLMLKREQ